MPRQKGCNDKNVTELGRQLYERYFQTDDLTELRGLLQQVGEAFKIKGNRTFGKRYGKLPSEWYFSVVVDPRRFVAYIEIRTKWGKGPIIAKYRILWPTQLWDITSLRSALDDYHRFLKQILKEDGIRS